MNFLGNNLVLVGIICFELSLLVILYWIYKKISNSKKTEENFRFSLQNKIDNY